MAGVHSITKLCPDRSELPVSRSAFLRIRVIGDIRGRLLPLVPALPDCGYLLPSVPASPGYVQSMASSLSSPGSPRQQVPQHTPDRASLSRGQLLV